MLGYELEELAPEINTFIRLIHPDALAATWDAVQASSRKNGVFQWRNYMLRKDGGYSWILATGRITRFDAHGSHCKWQGHT